MKDRANHAHSFSYCFHFLTALERFLELHPAGLNACLNAEIVNLVREDAMLTVEFVVITPFEICSNSCDSYMCKYVSILLQCKVQKVLNNTSCCLNCFMFQVRSHLPNPLPNGFTFLLDALGVFLSCIQLVA